MKLKKQAALTAAAALANVATAQDGGYGASACSVTTVYVPITYTITSGVPVSNSTTSDVTYTATTTHTSTATETFTVTAPLSEQPQATSAVVDPTTGSPGYAYTVNSAGNTEWISGNSPSSGAMLATVTSTVTIQPVPPGETAAAIQSTSTVLSTETVTPPPYTSTVYSFMTPDLTSTSTSTHYVTYTLSQVGSEASITTTRTTLFGPSSAGWNATTSAPSASPEETSGPTLTTITVITYYGTGTRTTSTYTTLITTTVQSEYTTTISQVVETSLTNGETTTFTTGVPVTITPGKSGATFSTSVTAPETNSVPSQSGQATANPAGTSTSAGISPNPYATPGSVSSPSPSNGSVSSGSPTFSNATSPASTQSPIATQPGISASTSSPDSITHTISPAALTGTSSLQTTPYAGSSSTSPVSSATGSPRRISSTISGVAPSVSPHFSANGTISITSKEHSSTLSSLPSGSLSTSETRSNGTASSTLSGKPNAGQPTAHSTSTSTVYEFSSPSKSRTDSPGAQTPRVSIPSPSIPTKSPPPLSSGSSSPSTLTTSRRSKSSRGSNSSAVLSPTSVISTPYSLATFNSTATSRSGRTSRSKSSSAVTTSLAGSTKSQSSGRVTIQTSLPSIVSTTTTANVTNPFPASSATATPSAGCGEQGPFTVNFDDLPRFLPTPNQTQPDITNAPPIPRPYHHLTFSDGYVYAPELKEPYQPVSPPHLAVFLANATGKSVSGFSDLVKPGEIGDGPRESISAFWFDAMSGYFGCDNQGPQACVLRFSAYTWSAAAGDEILTYAQNATIPACPSLTSMDCQLQKVEFPQSFRGLTGLQIQAYTGNDQRMFFMDNLEMNWTNTSCAAGLLRQSSS